MEVPELLALLGGLAVMGVGLALAIRSSGRTREAPPEAMGPPGSVLAASLRKTLSRGLADETWTELEEVLLAADVGVEASQRIVEGARATRPSGVEEAREALADEMAAVFGGGRDLVVSGTPAVVLVVGVNGSGKTTTAAKLARLFQEAGMAVVLGAADTFRAAAADQLAVWAGELGVHAVLGQEGGDPASVAHDAIASARARGADAVIVDTAGRLHGKRNLMAELEKIHRVATAAAGVSETLLVLDATAGQNGLAQAEEFSRAVPVTGIVLTKMDSTAKGGIVIAVEHRLGVPVKLVGTGEALDDLAPFDPEDFVERLLGSS